MTFDRIAVLGGGAWGTALANVAARAGRSVMLWEYEVGNAEQLAKRRESRYLPGVRIDDGIAVTQDLAEAARAQATLLVVPAQAVRSVARALAPAIVQGTPVIVCAKGIERGTRKFMTEVIAECAPQAVPAILSGPSFAADVARGLPTAVTIAAQDESLAVALAQSLASRSFRLYQSGDVRGVEIGGAAEECPGDCVRHRDRARTWGERVGGADHPGLRRVGAVWPGLRRQAGDHDGAFRSR